MYCIYNCKLSLFMHPASQGKGTEGERPKHVPVNNNSTNNSVCAVVALNIYRSRKTFPRRLRTVSYVTPVYAKTIALFTPCNLLNEGIVRFKCLNINQVLQLTIIALQFITSNRTIKCGTIHPLLNEINSTKMPIN